MSGFGCLLWLKGRPGEGQGLSSLKFSKRELWAFIFNFCISLSTSRNEAGAGGRGERRVEL